MAITYTAGDPNQEAPAATLKPGTYSFSVVDAEEKTSRAGNPMIEFKARHMKDDGSEGRAVYGNLVFTEKALWKVDEFLSACGKHPGEGEEVSLDANEMIGWEFTAEIEVTQDNKGRDRNEFSKFIADDDKPF